MAMAPNPRRMWSAGARYPAVLDVGCGPGRHVLACAERGMIALGLDAAAAIEIALARGAPVLQRSIFASVPGPVAGVRLCFSTETSESEAIQKHFSRGLEHYSRAGACCLSRWKRPEHPVTRRRRRSSQTATEANGSPGQS